MEFAGHALPKTFRATHWHQGRLSTFSTRVLAASATRKHCVSVALVVSKRSTPLRILGILVCSQNMYAILHRQLIPLDSFSLSLDLFPDPSCQFEDVWPQPSGSRFGSGMLRGRRFLIQPIPNSCPARHLQCTREDGCCPCLPNPRPRNMWSHRPICCGKPISDLH